MHRRAVLTGFPLGHLEDLPVQRPADLRRAEIESSQVLVLFHAGLFVCFKVHLRADVVALCTHQASGGIRSDLEAILD